MNNELNINKKIKFGYSQIVKQNKIFLFKLKKKLDNKKIKNYILIDKHCYDPISHLLHYNNNNNNKQAINFLNFFLDKKKSELLSDQKLPVIFQDTNLIKVNETRNYKFHLDQSLTKSDINKYNSILKKLVKILGNRWKKYISIIKYISVIKLNNKKNSIFFSGTSTNSQGAIHLCKPFTELKLLECLTHEASHIWLDKLEMSNNEFAKNGWTKNNFISPWRSDKRPVSGIIHAAYVFSFVCKYLIQYYKKTNNSKFLYRAIFLSQKIHLGLNEMKKCKEITKLGLEVNNISLKNIKSVDNFIKTKVSSQSLKKLNEINFKKKYS